MKKLTLFLIISLLFFGTLACQDTTKTSVTAPESEKAQQPPTAETTKAAQEDAQSEARRRQLNADIRAREERELAGEPNSQRTADDLSSEVRSKLEANIPGSQLTVKATKDGTVTILGTVNNKEQLEKIEPLAKEINGVRLVIVKANIAPPQG